MSYRWQLPEKINSEFAEKFPELNPIAAVLLNNRGLTTQAEIDEFLQPDYSQDIHDPYLFGDMQKAVSRIYQARDQDELITIYGDYDADGVSAAVILKTALDSIGAKVEVFLPHREKDGYGLNSQAVTELINQGTDLFITCDCGVSNYEEVELINSQGKEIIISDHHSVPDKTPRALAIIHPQFAGEKYPFKFLAGGGVAFKLAQAILADKKSALGNKEREIAEKWLLDLVAVSTVADMVPLLGENRTLVKYGLRVLKKTKRLGLIKLIETANLDPQKIDARSIAYSLAPRINAAGRMDHANLAYYLLIENDEERATQLARDLNDSNASRQKLTEQIVREAKEQSPDLGDKLLVFFDPSWPAGLTGLIAGRLVREYDRPCLVMTEVDGQIIGSGRSIAGFNITQALTINEQLLIRYGGHPQAAGFAMERKNLDKLISTLKDRANTELADSELIPVLPVELVIDFEDISWELADLLAKFQPFGQKNEEPLFMSVGLKVTAVRKVGLDQKHLKLELVKGNISRGAIAFGLASRDIQLGDMINIVYNLSINEWNGNREIQLNIKDIKNYEPGK